jgi:hypothetical protein
MSMELKLPEELAAAMQPLVAALPLSEAMPELVVAKPPSAELVLLVERVCAQPAVAANPALQAGLWLYGDALDRSHTISQGIKDATGSFWHGIMHRREGDFSNSHYWFAQTGSHPAMAAIPNYDGHAFIDAVAANAGTNPPELVQTQREEWAALFSWCARSQ